MLPQFDTFNDIEINIPSFEIYNEFLNIIKELKLDEIDSDIIQRQTKNRYWIHNSPSFNNVFWDDYNKDYSLLESVTRTYPLLSIYDHVQKKYKPSFKYNLLPKHIQQLANCNQKWVSNIIKSNINAYNSVIENYNLETWQFVIPDNKDGSRTSVFILLPNLYHNVYSIDGAMKCFGYYRSCVIPIIELDQRLAKMKDWIAVKYEQRIQDYINDKIKKEKYLYHVSPSIYEEKILKQGLIPKSKNDIFDYPDRIYLIDETKTNDLKKTLYNVASMLYRAKKDKSDNKYNVYRIDVSKLTNTNFSIDYNYEPFAVFTADNIPPDALTIEYKITIE